MKATENLDTLYLVTLLDQLNQISQTLVDGRMRPSEDIVYEAQVRLDQLRVRIGKDLRKMSKQEAADDSEMPLGPIAARDGYTSG